MKQESTTTTKRVPQIGEFTRLGVCMGKGFAPFPKLVRLEKREGVASFIGENEEIEIISEKKWSDLNRAEQSEMEKFYLTFNA